MKFFPKHQTENVRLLFFLRGLYKFLSPGVWARRRLTRFWEALDATRRAELQARVDYYCRLDKPFDVGAKAVDISTFRWSAIGKKTNYYFDLLEHLRLFSGRARFNYRFGDKTFIPERPSFVKARPIEGDVGHSVLINLDKIRHFNFVHDPLPWEEKQDMLVWRGSAKQEHRTRMFEAYFGHALFDLGSTYYRGGPEAWRKPFMTIRDQLKYKFILSIEGNDVATNLKWIMSSGSLCFMPKPRFETWFLEGTLVAGEHYVEVKDDFSDMEEKVLWYRDHPEDAKRIVANANRYVQGFGDATTEAAVAMKVLEKYFRLSGQIDG